MLNTGAGALVLVQPWRDGVRLSGGNLAVKDPAAKQSSASLKLSGMHWTVVGASASATLRCQQASRPEDPIWHSARNQTPAA